MPDGNTFDVPIAALATDTPPADDPLIAANAVALESDDGTLSVDLILENRSDQPEALTGAISTSVTVNVDQTELPAHQQITLTDIPGLAGALKKDAFQLTLTFDSGRQITLAVPVQVSGGAS